MPPHRRVTQKDIARELGVHRTTVCLALKNYPNIPAATQQRVREAAARLGYVPDPMLSALAAYRSSQAPKAFHGTLAWLVNHSEHQDWRRIVAYRDYLSVATSAAKKLGYSVEVFECNTREMPVRRMSKILRARNISGLLVCPQPRPNSELEFPWENFSAITFGYSLVKPALHCVTPSHYRACLQTIQQLRAAGHRRIGFAHSQDFDQRINHNCLAAYMAESYIHQAEPFVLPFLDRQYTPRELKRWVKKMRIEAAVVSYEILDILRESDLRIPGDLAVACPCLDSTETELSGVHEDVATASEVAVNFLVSMMQRGERGVPGRPQRILIEGTWNPGRTLESGR